MKRLEGCDMYSLQDWNKAKNKYVKANQKIMKHRSEYTTAELAEIATLQAKCITGFGKGVTMSTARGVAVEWDTENIKTNLKLEGGNLVPDETIKPNSDLSNWNDLTSLPANIRVVYNAGNQTLTYHNYSGTPVNKNYKVFIPVTYGYKWKTMLGYVAVEVISNQGTDDNQN